MDVDTEEYNVFTEQKHRFELDACDFKYNGKSFKMGMTLTEVEDISGHNYIIYSNEFYEENTKKNFWLEKGFEVTISNSLVTPLYIYKRHIFRISRCYITR